MALRTYLVAIVLASVFVLATVFAGAIAASSHQATLRPYTENTSTTVNYSTTTVVGDTLDTHVERVLDNETVRNASGTVLEDGVDYRWNTSVASDSNVTNTTVAALTWLNSSATTSGDNASITYHYQGAPSSVSVGRPISAVIVQYLPYILFAVFAIAVVAFFAAVWTFGTWDGLHGSGGVR